MQTKGVQHLGAYHAARATPSVTLAPSALFAHIYGLVRRRRVVGTAAAADDGSAVVARLLLLR